MQPFLSVPTLGKSGRFGNQLLIYLFARTYAQRHGLKLHLPPWVGQQLFGTAEEPLPPGTVVEQRVLEKTHHGRDDTVILNLPQPLRNAEIDGYFQYHTSWYTDAEEAAARRWFVPRPEIAQQLAAPLQRLRDAGQTLVAIHQRRGDQGVDCYFRTPAQWYLDWLAQHWSRLRDPVLFIASDDPHAWEEFEQYKPFTSRSLEAQISADPLPVYNYLPYEFRTGLYDFYPDFYFLQQAQVVLHGQTTFGFTACLFSERAGKYWRAHLPTQTFQQYDPWDACPLDMSVDVADYGHIPGVRMPEDEVRRHHAAIADRILSKWQAKDSQRQVKA